MKKQKTLYAEASIYYVSAAGVTRVQFRRGPFKTNARDTETARASYAKHVRHATDPRVIAQMHHMNMTILDPCDPCDRWILESDGSEEAARILAICDEQNTAAGREIPRASFI